MALKELIVQEIKILEIVYHTKVAVSGRSNSGFSKDEAMSCWMGIMASCTLGDIPF